MPPSDKRRARHHIPEVDPDVTNPDPAHVALWRKARTLDELGQLGAQWLEGHITYLPGDFGTGPDTETGPLVQVLAEANRHGYYTHFSQPGTTYPSGDAQRAAVSGFCTEELADRIATAVLRTDLVTLAAPVGWTNPIQIPVTTDEGNAFTWVGGGWSPDDIDNTYGDDCPHVVAALKAAWHVEVIDPMWGREALLWERLRAVWAA